MKRAPLNLLVHISWWTFLVSCWVWGYVLICILTGCCQVAIFICIFVGQMLLSTYYVSSPDVTTDMEGPSPLNWEAEGKGKEPGEIWIGNYQGFVETLQEKLYGILPWDRWGVWRADLSLLGSSLWNAIVRAWDWQSVGPGSGPGSASNSLCDLG